MEDIFPLFFSLVLSTKLTLPPIRAEVCDAAVARRSRLLHLPFRFYLFLRLFLDIEPQWLSFDGRIPAAAAASLLAAPALAATPAAPTTPGDAAAPALPICQSPAARPPSAPQSAGLGGRTRAVAAASEDPATSSVSASYSAPSRGDCLCRWPVRGCPRWRRRCCRRR